MEGRRTRPPGPPHKEQADRIRFSDTLTPKVLTAGDVGPKERYPHPRGTLNDPLGCKQKVLRCLFVFFLKNKEIKLCSHLKCRWTPVHVYKPINKYTYMLRVRARTINRGIQSKSLKSASLSIYNKCLPLCVCLHVYVRERGLSYAMNWIVSCQNSYVTVVRVAFSSDRTGGPLSRRRESSLSAR